jgi:valyl-tRNA synthetase
MKIDEARAIVVLDMQKKGLIEKIDQDYTHSVATCYKCGRTIEPRVLEQWFVAVNKKGQKTGKNLAKDAIQAVKDKKVQFVTKKFEKIYNHWMSNIRDWCISRQIVWGIQIPAYYCDSCGKDNPIVSEIKPSKCPKCGSSNLTQDSDVFDTWFSSGQWPFAALKTTGDFDKFYPTQIMETAWDILFFWVARMIMIGLYETDKVPFEKVYIHGLVRDQDRQKMSKSKGNVIDPLGIAEQYGTDAVRMALVFGSSAGNDTSISEDKIRGMRNFANKLWNISRFVLIAQNENSKLKTQNSKSQLIIQNLTDKDAWILKELDHTVKKVTKYFDNFKYSQAGEEIYEFVWHKFADIYLEKAKDQLANEKLKENTQAILLSVLKDTLKILHPIMPFVTEEIWSKLPGNKEMLIVESWKK